jgi:uncharacterized delta-60 repeat protein
MKNHLYSSLCFVASLVLAVSIPQTVCAQAIDASFAPPQVFRPALVKQMAQAANGKMYVVGEISHSGDTKVAKVVRLTPSGFLDTSFKAELPADKDVSFIEVLPSGNVIVVTEYGLVDTYHEMWVLAVNGKLLKYLKPPVGYITSIKGLPDNSFIVGGGSAIVRYSKAFNLDNTFKGFNDLGAPIEDIQFQGSKILICGDFDFLGYTNGPIYQLNNIARINMDGTLDTTFLGGRDYLGDVQKMLVTPDGKIYPTGNLVTPAFRLNADGTSDSSFHYPFYPRDVIFNNDNLTVQGTNQIVRIDLNGVIDSTFAPVNVPGNAVTTVLPDKSVIVANYNNVRYGIAKFTGIGELTDAYKSQLLRRGNIVDVRAQASSVYISGDFVKVNSLLTYDVAKLNHDGSIDPTFAITENNGPVSDIQYVGSGNLVVAASKKLFRANSKGKVDASFNFTPIPGASIAKVIQQRDGKILIGGSRVMNVYRLNTNGTIDSTFNTGSGPCCVHMYGTTAYDFDLDKNTGKIIFSGYFETFNGVASKGLVRLNSDGSVDSSFNVGTGAVLLNDVTKVKMLSNGSVLLSGDYYQYNGTDINREFLRVNSDGSLHSEFNTNMAGLDFYEPSVIETFRDRILIAANEYYSGLHQRAINTVGIQDTSFHFPSGVDIAYLNGYYSNNTNELYAFGTIDVSGQSTQSLMRFRYDDPAPLAAVTSTKEGTTARQTSDTDISFYPNPAKNFINIDAGGNATVAIYDWTGAASLRKEISNSEGQIDIGHLPRGRYVLAITKGKKTERKHFVKE